MFKPKQQINYFDLIPVRNIEEFTNDEGKITLLLPKFKSAWMRKWFLPGKRSKHFRIHLDEMGSKVWLLIDGTKNVNEICTILIINNIDEGNLKSQMEIRVTKFLSQLYTNKFIKF